MSATRDHDNDDPDPRSFLEAEREAARAAERADLVATLIDWRDDLVRWVRGPVDELIERVRDPLAHKDMAAILSREKTVRTHLDERTDVYAYLVARAAGLQASRKYREALLLTDIAGEIAAERHVGMRKYATAPIEPPS